MIVPMRHVTLLVLAGGRDAALSRLRDLGLLHLTVAPADTVRVRDAKQACAEAEQAIGILKRTGKRSANVSSRKNDKARTGMSALQIIELDREISRREAERDALEKEERRYAPFGEFDPAAVRALAEQGLPVRLFKANAKKFSAASDYPVFVIYKNGGEVFGAAFAKELPEDCVPVELPSRSLAETRAKIAAVCGEIAQKEVTLAAASALLPQLAATLAKNKERAAFADAWEGMDSHGAIDSIQGFMPAEKIPELQAAAATYGWGFTAREPVAGEVVPTLLRPPKAFRPILEIFKALNISPAYDESDVSVPFYLFFSIFFAMIIGDAGYGLLLFAAVVAARLKLREKMPRPVFLLGLVFSVATIFWGVLTATYFGIPADVLPPFLAHPVARWFADANNTMLFCFMLGTVHLSLARMWNAVLLFPNPKFLAQLGWAGTLWGICFIICSIVVQDFARPVITIPLLAVSVPLIFLFTVGKGEFKAHGFDLVMLPLTLFGTMGDIISYLRLFAIGLASVQIAQTFNLMAVGLPLPIWLKIPALLLILLFAHSLNLVMGGLSVLVHAVRLNTLEFANAKGVSWSGQAYRPFKKSTSTIPTITSKETP